MKNIMNLAKQFISRLPKITALNKAGVVLSFVIVLGVSPIGKIEPTNPQQVSKTNIVFNQNNPFVFDETVVKTQIEVGVSNFDIASKPALANSVEVKYPDANAHVDPTEFRPVYMAAAKQFNIPWQLIEAVHQVESGKSGSTNKRSYAGATGPMQFMPGTWRGYATDGNGDGSADITDVTDAIYTGAHYLATSGADTGDIDGALFNYNHSMAYVNKVKTVAYEIGLPK